MKTLLALTCFACIVNVNTSFAQDVIAKNDTHSPLYDYSERHLNHMDTIPGFNEQDSKLKISGTIYYNDGVTPAKDVIVYVYQPNADGDFKTHKTTSGKKYIEHRAWVKTNADGEYTIYTFIPGAPYVPLTYPRKRGMKQILPVIKVPGKPEYDFDAFIFDDDPAISDRCRKKLERMDYQGMLTLRKEGDLYVAEKNIVLKDQHPAHTVVASL
ncbi:hypothetical protein [Aestuariivivens sediminis]|uniref:hypothetical protein n=1 Tax=Aestuariivivens sediminis TaxID=2913557 RepID=UPI001F5679A4|nr:hypothetical protein [Aestuariivivens sediminis]